MDNNTPNAGDSLDLSAEYPGTSGTTTQTAPQMNQGNQTEQTDVTLTLNGEEQTFTVHPDTPLLYVLRNDAGLNGPKFGCGLAQCGACTVAVDGEPTLSCVTPVNSVSGGSVTTLQGLAQGDSLHPIQEAFIEEQAAQCGYCIPGMIMRSYTFLQDTDDPSRDEIKQELSQNLCRCGTHMRVLRAVELADERMNGGQNQGQSQGTDASNSDQNSTDAQPAPGDSRSEASPTPRGENGTTAANDTEATPTEDGGR